MSLVSVLLHEERLEDLSYMCRHFQSWRLRSAETECNQGQNSFLWQVTEHVNNIDITMLHIVMVLCSYT